MIETTGEDAAQGALSRLKRHGTVAGGVRLAGGVTAVGVPMVQRIFGPNGWRQTNSHVWQSDASLRWFMGQVYQELLAMNVVAELGGRLYALVPSFDEAIFALGAARARRSMENRDSAALAGRKGAEAVFADGGRRVSFPVAEVVPPASIKTVPALIERLKAVLRKLKAPGDVRRIEAMIETGDTLLALIGAGCEGHSRRLPALLTANNIDIPRSDRAAMLEMARCPDAVMRAGEPFQDCRSAAWVLRKIAPNLRIA
ncbi:hypothetical protein [Variovorax sp. J22R115]|uniref:hypothetical protein n=1 Tax=Variovorax sp. J22R115 TaxID=3053509 RepID=UPI0025784E2B|nr:hypothetical protein [Variovorax sp. J22R115]MDM0052021.1 hypothetical protein [Variovorax sp. J22R115]